MPSSSKFEGQPGLPAAKVQQAPISLEGACSALGELWSPRVVGQVNNQYIKVAKVQGEFPWHSHEHEDEMFLVLRGLLRIGRAEADGGVVLLHPGEFFVVPRGVASQYFGRRGDLSGTDRDDNNAAYGRGADAADPFDCRATGCDTVIFLSQEPA